MNATAPDTTHNGWRNYETWAVNLWLDNEEGTYNYWRERAREAYAAASADSIWTREQRARYTLADTLKAEIEESLPDLGASMAADLLGAALSEVHWDEIAEHMIDAAIEDES